jgi:hypothetical protein
MPDPNGRHSLLGAIALLVVGLLFLTTSGLCTASVMAKLIANFGYRLFEPPAWRIAALAVAIGGPFILLGGYMVWLGVKWLRR